MTRFLIVALASALATSLAIAQSANDKSVTRLDPALDAVVSPDAKVELVKGGFGFTEGPVWVQEGTTGYLLFTDIPGNVVWKLTADGQASVFASNVGYTGPEVWRWGGIQNNGFDRSDPRFEEFAMIGADGLTLDRQGRLILATFAGRSLMRIEKDGTRTVLVDRYDGKRFGGPNDVVVKSDGAIYFTDTFGAFRLRDRDPRKELDFNGVYMWKDGKLTLVVKDMPRVNGLAFSEKTAITPRQNHKDCSDRDKVNACDCPGRKSAHLVNAHAMCRVCLRAEAADCVELASGAPGPPCDTRVLRTEMFESARHDSLKSRSKSNDPS
jgi:gluconolactonase